MKATTVLARYKYFKKTCLLLPLIFFKTTAGPAATVEAAASNMSFYVSFRKLGAEIKIIMHTIRKLDPNGNRLEVATVVFRSRVELCGLRQRRDQLLHLLTVELGSMIAKKCRRLFVIDSFFLFSLGASTRMVLTRPFGSNDNRLTRVQGRHKHKRLCPFEKNVEPIENFLSEAKLVHV